MPPASASPSRARARRRRDREPDGDPTHADRADRGAERPDRDTGRPTAEPPARADRAGDPTYKVKAGDTLIGIAAKFKVTVAAIRS